MLVLFTINLFLNFTINNMKNIISILIVVIMSTCFILSCKKNDNIADNNKWVYTDSLNSTNLRLIHCYAGNTPQLSYSGPNTGPIVYAYANGAKLNGNPLSYGGQWPGASVYANIPYTGNIRFDFVLARQNFTVVPIIPAPTAGDTLLTTTLNLEKGQNYSIFFGDSTGGPFTATAVKDVIVTPAEQKYKIRLANYLMNPTDTLDLFSVRQNANIVTGITHKKISDWVVLDLPVIPDSFYLRKPGQTTNFITVITPGTNPAAPTITPINLRHYTVIARGKNGVTGKTNSAATLTNF
jgi:hypothetical protein